MKIDKSRHLLILEALIQENKAITAEKLALLSRSSVRTIKNDIAELKKDLLNENIAKIISSRAKGYMIEPLDQNKYENLIYEIEAMKRLYNKRQKEDTDRSLYIIQRLLTEGNILIDDICDSLYISRSIVSKDIETVKNFLNSYNIKVQSQSKKGLVISGDELALRKAIVEANYSLHYQNINLNNYAPFEAMFYDDINQYTDVRHAFLKILRESDISVSDLASKTIPAYMCLVRYRLKNGKQIVLEKNMIDEIKKTYDYKIARKVAQDETIRSFLIYPEIEVVNLARIILIYRDIDIRSKGNNKMLTSILNDNAVLYNKVLKKAKHRLGKSLYNVEFYRFIEADVQSLQMQLYLKNHFDSTNKIKMATYIERNQSLLSPVPLEMARIMVGFLKEEFKSDIKEPVVINYAAYFELLMKRIMYPYHKMRFVVTATEGLVYSQGLKENLNQKYGNFIEKIDVYNLYEMRKINFNDYDALIHSGNLMYYQYPLKTITYDEIDYQKDEDKELREFLKQGYDRNRIEKIKTFIHVKKDIAVDNLDYFIESILYRYCNSESNYEALLKDFYNKREIIDYYSERQRSVMILLDYRYVKNEFIDIYIPKKEVYYRDNLETKFIVLACINPDNDVTSLKIDNYVLQCINQINGVVDKIVQDKDKAVDQIYDQVIEKY